MSSQDLSIDTSEMNVIFVHSAIDDYPLTVEEFRVYSHIARRAGAGEAWPKIENIAKHCRIHPDTARRCLHNLIEYGLLQATERKGKTTLYRITRPSLWKRPETALAIQKAQADANRAKRASKKVQKENAKAHSENDPSLQTPGVQTPPFKHDPSGLKGGHPSGLKGGHPSGMKGDEVNPLRGSLEENPSSSVSVDAGADWLPDDDDFPADAETLNPNPTTKALHRPDPVQPSSQAAETPPPTDPENVPGAAAGGAAWAILALPVIPRGELEARAPRDPSGIPQLRALLHCSHKSRLPQLQVELEAATRSGIPRALLTRLTDQELKAATSAAKTDAPKVEGGFARAGIHALHRLIGEPLTPGVLKGERPGSEPGVRGWNADVGPANLPQAPQPAPEVETPRVSIEVGSRWEHKHIRDKIGTVVASEGGWVELHNGERVMSYEFGTNYRRVD